MFFGSIARSVVATSTRAATTIRPSAVVTVHVRALSSDCEPAQKLKCIFEEYRREHFSRETPSRFRKELIKAAVNAGHVQGAVEVDTLNQVLVNIGSSERLSDDELNQILAAAGGETKGDRIISVDKMLQLM